MDLHRLLAATTDTGKRDWTYFGEVVNGGELNETGHAVAEGGEDEPVERRGVVHFG